MSKIKYFVEGECEEALLRAFMSETGQSFKLGKINVLNLNNECITKSFALSLSPKTELVIVIDTDVSSTKILENNLTTILKYSSLTKEQIHIVMSVKTLEDEIVFASSNWLFIRSFQVSKSFRIASKTVAAWSLEPSTSEEIDVK